MILGWEKGRLVVFRFKKMRVCIGFGSRFCEFMVGICR